MKEITPDMKLKLECLRIVWLTASRVGVEEDGRVKAAEKLYKYVTGEKAKAPSDTTS